MSNHAADVCAAGVPQSGILHHGGTGAAPPGCAVEQTRQRTFTSTLDGLRKIARHEGVATLWRGLSPTLVMAVPGNIIYFTGYEWLRFDGASPVQRAVPDEYASLAAGAVARVLAATAISPVEMFRTRLQASHGASARGHVVDTFHSLREAVGRDGYRALWRGLTLTLWRDVPFSGMYWWGYETIRGKLTDWREYQRGRAWEPEPECASRGRRRRRSQSRETHAETFRDSFVAGAASGAFASVVTTPFDVGKTRTQVYRDAGVQAAAGPGEKRPGPQSMARLLWHIFRAEGVAGLFTGWIPRTLKVAPACAIMISSYEAGKRVFRSMNEQALLRDQENRRDDEPGNP